MFSCNTEQAPIAPAKMKSLMYEIHLAEALAQHLPKDSLQFTLKNEDSLKQYTADILKRYGVNATQFSKSMDYYKKQPGMLDSIYGEMLSEIAIEHARQK